MDKLLSVVVTTYNRHDLTVRAINTVRTKNPDAIEIVVVDDCSSPQFEFRQLHNACGIGVRLIRTITNCGPGEARQLGVTAACGKLVAFLDSDDSLENGWLDAVLNAAACESSRRLVIVGKTRGGPIANKLVWHSLALLPKPIRLACARLFVLLFNPFSTGSVAAHGSLWRFKEGLRYCEDYYTNALALFSADKLLLVRMYACELNRATGSPGGESRQKRRMWRGEFLVRRHLLREPGIPHAYKFFIPLGMLYQMTRVATAVLLKYRLRVP